MQIRVLVILCGLALFAGSVAGAYVLVFRAEQNPSLASGSGRVREGKAERPLGQGAVEIAGRASVEAGEAGALVDFGRGVRVTLKPGARIEVVSKSEHVVSVEWEAGDIDGTHDGKAGVSLAVAVELPGHDGARFLTTGGQIAFWAGGKGKSPSVAVAEGDVLREHRGDIARARKGESLAVRAVRATLQEMSAELVRTVGTGGSVATPAPDGEGTSGASPSAAGEGAPATSRGDAARAEAVPDARRTDAVARAQEKPTVRAVRTRASARAASRGSAASDARRTAPATRVEPTARRDERATAAPDGSEETRTRIKRVTTWR
ncbi:MAG: hypothetical protein HYY84_11300 [Deltaproteobacteria bacterium]|nr:hypothetical protein [Deltaproteobacteria bacterium]